MPTIQNKSAPTDVVMSMYTDYTHGMDTLNATYSLLGDMSPLRYWEDGRKRFNSVFPGADRGVNDWMSPYFSQMTRNKCLGIVAHTVSKMIDSSIIAQNAAQEEDTYVAEFLKDGIEYTKRKEKFDEKLFWAIITAIAEGTAVLYDGYGPLENIVAGKRKNGAYTLLVPNDEFIVYDPFVHDVQEQEWVMWRRKMTYGRAKKFFGDYKTFDQVIPGNSSRWETDISEFKQYDQFADLRDNEVEVNMRWKKEDGKTLLDVVANGVQLTEDGEEDYRKDGQYPFAVGGFEPIDAHFAWFASLTKKLEQEQTESDHLWRTYINLQELKNKPPVRTNRPELVREDIVIPGNVVFDGEIADARTEPILPNLAQGIDQGTVNLITALMRNADDSSINPQQIGGSNVGSQTATESLQIAQNSEIMMGLFGRQMSFLVRDWAKLRVQTFIWRVTEDEDLSKITVHDRLLKTGKTGDRKYQMEEGLGEMLKAAKEGNPDMQKMVMSKSMELKNEQEDSDGKKETILIDPKELLNLELYVFTDGEPKPKRTDALSRAMALEDFRLYMSAPQIFNVREAAEDLVRSRGGDPERLIAEEGQVPQQGVPGGEQPEGGPQADMAGSIKKLMGQPTS